MGERFPYKEEVGGSIPSTPTTVCWRFRPDVVGDLGAGGPVLAGFGGLGGFWPPREGVLAYPRGTVKWLGVRVCRFGRG